MEKIRKHLQESFDKADEEYWKIFGLSETKEKELKTLKAEVDFFRRDLELCDVKRKHFEGLLNELNDEKK